jgi:hypothetical protein
MGGFPEQGFQPCAGGPTLTVIGPARSVQFPMMTGSASTPRRITLAL